MSDRVDRRPKPIKKMKKKSNPFKSELGKAAKLKKKKNTNAQVRMIAREYNKKVKIKNIHKKNSSQLHAEMLSKEKALKAMVCK